MKLLGNLKKWYWIPMISVALIIATLATLWFPYRVRITTNGGIIGISLNQNIARADVTPNDLATSTQANGWVLNYGDFQKKTFYAVGLYWQFYCASEATNNGINYRTSVDGISWSSNTSLFNNATYLYGHSFGGAVSGTKFAYAREDAGVDEIIRYRQGTLSNVANVGVITWDAAEQVAYHSTNFLAYSPSIYYDSNGYNWISYSNSNSASYYGSFVTKNANNDGTWSTDAGFPKTIVADGTTNGLSIAEIAPVSGGVMHVIYSKPMTDGARTDGYLYENIWNGGSWGGEAQISDYKLPYSQFSVAATGDIVDVVYQQWTSTNTTFDFMHAHYSGSWGADTLVETAPTGLQYPNLVSNGQDVYLVWTSRPTLKHIYYRKYSNGVWGDQVDWYTDANTIYGSADDGQANGIWFGNVNVSYGNSRILVAYLTGTASPFQIRFGIIDDIFSPSSNAGGGWTNPQNAYANNSNYANITSGNPSANTTWGTYGANITAGATINSVRVRYDAWSMGISSSSTQVPTGNGTTSGAFTQGQTRVAISNNTSSGTWTASTGQLWSCIDDLDIRGTSADGDYITSPTASGGGNIYFNFTSFNIPAGSVVKGVYVYDRAEKTSGAGDNYAESIRVGTTNVTGTSQTLVNGTFGAFASGWTTNPATSAAWTYDEVNGTDATAAHNLRNFGIISTDLSPSAVTSAMVIECVYVDGAGEKMYENVDETVADDTDFIMGTTDTSNYFHFTYTAFAIPTSGVTVTNLQVVVRARDGLNAATGTNNVTAGIRVNGTNYDTGQTTTDPTSVFATTTYTYTTNPNTGSAWTPADINGTGANPLQQFGFASSDGNPDYDVSMVYAQVNYIECDDTISISVTWDGGTSWSTANTTTLTTTETTYWAVVTGVTSWTTDKLSDSNFKVMAYATTVNNAEEVRLDWIPVEVTYTLGATPSISVSPTSYNFGVIQMSSTTNTTTTYFTLANSSSMTTNMTIAVTTSNWTTAAGGTDWIHSDTATAGTNQAGLKSQRGGTWGSDVVIVKYASPNYIYQDCPASTNFTFGLSLIAPTDVTDGKQKTIIVRIDAHTGT